MTSIKIILPKNKVSVTKSMCLPIHLYIHSPSPFFFFFERALKLFLREIVFKCLFESKENCFLFR